VKPGSCGIFGAIAIVAFGAAAMLAWNEASDLQSQAVKLGYAKFDENQKFEWKIVDTNQGTDPDALKKDLKETVASQVRFDYVVESLAKMREDLIETKYGVKRLELHLVEEDGEGVSQDPVNLDARPEQQQQNIPGRPVDPPGIPDATERELEGDGEG
jgi:hypothetical protein